MLSSLVLSIIGLTNLPLAFANVLDECSPTLPKPEPVELRTLPLPPAIADDSPAGSCKAPTGCTGQNTEFASGSFLPDGRHVLVTVKYVGSENGSIYDGVNLLAVKSDGGAFSNGEPWKCLTCGHYLHGDELFYPQAFHDRKRALIGINILDCGDHDLVSPECDGEMLKVHPIYWNTAADSTGKGGDLRELRLHPDNIHLGFNSFTQTVQGLGQFAYFSRLQFNPSPDTGLPLVPRYDLINVTRLFDPNAVQPLEAHDKELVINTNAISVGELRGFSGDGTEVFYVGYPAESSNIDVFAVNLQTGKVRRLTQHPEYVDPIDSSPDSRWVVIMDTRGTDRQMWVSGMRGIPPITDLVSTSVTSATRNNGQRRFFRPYLLDKWGDRCSYFGQQLNAQGSGIAGSGDLNDPEWSARADPRWSLDGTEVVWWDTQTISPACGGENPLPCYPSKEPYGRSQRVVVAKLSSRDPYGPVVIEPVPDTVPWGIPYAPGSIAPSRPHPPPGKYRLRANSSGHAIVDLYSETNQTGPLSGVSVDYFAYADGKSGVLNGTERVEKRILSAKETYLDWNSNLTQEISGQINTKKTSSHGFQIVIDVLTNIFNANGTLVTSLGGKRYLQPANGT